MLALRSHPSEIYVQTNSLFYKVFLKNSPLHIRSRNVSFQRWVAIIKTRAETLAATALTAKRRRNVLLLSTQSEIIFKFQKQHIAIL